MKINRILIVSIVALTVFVNNDLLKGETVISGYAGESILYLISPFGRSEYNDLGVVDLKGIKVNLVIFKTQVLLFKDTENQNYIIVEKIFRTQDCDFDDSIESVTMKLEEYNPDTFVYDYSEED